MREHDRVVARMHDQGLWRDRLCGLAGVAGRGRAAAGVGELRFPGVRAGGVAENSPP